MWSRAASRSGDDARRHLEREVLGAAVLVGRRAWAMPAASAVLPAARVRVQHDARAAELGEDLGQELGGDAVDEEVLGGVADAGPVGLGVDRDRERLVEVGGRVDVDVAVADAGLDDRHGGLGDDGLDEVGAAARDEQVDQAAGGHQRPDGLAAARRAGRRRRRAGPARRGPRASTSTSARLVRRGGRAAAQDDGVAALEAEAGGVDGDVGARLVDHADDAHGHPDLADLQAVGQGRAAHHLADRVGQCGDVAQGRRRRRRPARGRG